MLAQVCHSAMHLRTGIVAFMVLGIAHSGDFGWADGPAAPPALSRPIMRAQSPVSAPAGTSSLPPQFKGLTFGALPNPEFDSEEPSGVVLGVAITGNQTVDETEIRRHIKTRKDRAYDPQLVQEDLRRLFATRKFHNVRVHKKTNERGVLLTFEVVERPMIGEVLFIGNQRFSDKKLLKESGLTSGEALNMYTVQEARRKIEEFYRSKGFAKTSVTVEEGDNAADRRVVLRVDEGRVERIWSVDFVGNDPNLATNGRLKTLIKSKPGYFKYLFRGKVDYSAIEEDRQRLVAYYRGLGYFKARVSREVQYDDSGQWASLTFVIDEGPRYRIRNMSVVGNKKFETQQLLDYMQLDEGDFFNLEKMQIDEHALREVYGGHGHIFADVKASPRFLEEPGQLDLVYQVDEGELFRVGKINIHVAGEAPNTRRNVILNRLSIHPGDIIDIREVRASERRLKASQLFIANPAEGTPPRIVIRPPDLAEAASMAEKQRNYRGQSPDRNDSARRSQPMVMDVFLPPFKSDQR